SATLISEALYYYDGATNWNTMPITCPSPANALCGGKVTRSDAWVDASNSYISNGTAYDTYGNVTSESDPLGHSKFYTMDSTYRLFVTRTTNALGQYSSSGYDY